jgi:hypothetical protein
VASLAPLGSPGSVRASPCRLSHWRERQISFYASLKKVVLLQRESTYQTDLALASPDGPFSFLGGELAITGP